MDLVKYSLPALFAGLIVVSATSLIGSTSEAQAQRLQNLTCSELWYERNAIYADKGHCFKTRRARRTFGRACFPPYGRLNSRERRRVSRIEQMEFRMGCR